MRIPRFAPGGEQIGPLRRFAMSSVVAWTMMGSYLLINHHQGGGPVTVQMPSWVPFLPVFFPGYIALLLVTWLLPLAIRDDARFRDGIKANIYAWLLVMPWWILTPTLMIRPPLPVGSWADCFRLLWACDQPCNVAPCAHGIGPVIVVWHLSREHPAWSWPLAVMLALGLSSIALVWQHRPIDILLGTAAAVVGLVVSRCRHLIRQTPPNSSTVAAQQP